MSPQFADEVNTRENSEIPPARVETDNDPVFSYVKCTIFSIWHRQWSLKFNIIFTIKQR